MAADNVPARKSALPTISPSTTPAPGGAIDVGWSLTITGNIVDGNEPGKLTVLDSFGGGVLVLAGYQHL